MSGCNHDKCIRDKCSVCCYCSEKLIGKVPQMSDFRQQILRTRRTKIFHLRKLVNSAYWAQAEYVTIKRYDLEALLIAVKIETKEELRKLKDKTDE